MESRTVEQTKSGWGLLDGERSRALRKWISETLRADPSEFIVMEEDDRLIVRGFVGKAIVSRHVRNDVLYKINNVLRFAR